MSASTKAFNLVNGEWTTSENYIDLPDPLNGNTMIKVPDTTMEEIGPFVETLKDAPKTGLHNPFKNKERYLLYGEVCKNVVTTMEDKDVFNFFVRCIQRCAPKSTLQAAAELQVTLNFFKNFCGDRVRFLAHSFRYPGDHEGSFTTAYRWPYGGVGVIAPFNFPIEIPVLQMMGALFMGNKVVIKPDQRTSFPLEQWVRMLHYCGMPKEDLSLIHCDGPVMEKILVRGNAQTTQFTGSSGVAERLVRTLKGKVRIEDAGFDWKVLGPDVPRYEDYVDYVAWCCDHDAYAFGG